ncbi:hypothetical protein MMU07_20460, partial [Aquiflexum sp. LQ15W]|uniref:hypothetical protein n=1 Tax=Cognataquiflexum nitidum TaxID=2922272 RepID=UPI001F131C6C
WILDIGGYYGRTNLILIDIGYWWIFSGEGLLGYLVNGYLGVEDRYSWILDIGGYYGRTNLILIDIGYWWIFSGEGLIGYWLLVKGRCFSG